MYTDFLGSQISDGDEIVFAQSAYGGGAELHRARIVKVVPLIPHRDGSGYMREDQANNRHPTKFTHKRYEDATKRFVVQIMRERWRSSRQGGPAPQKYTIPHSNSIVRVPDGV